MHESYIGMRMRHIHIYGPAIDHPLYRIFFSIKKSGKIEEADMKWLEQQDEKFFDEPIYEQLEILARYSEYHLNHRNIPDGPISHDSYGIINPKSRIMLDVGLFLLNQQLAQQRQTRK